MRGWSESEHDANLFRLMETAKREGLVFNSAKCCIKTTQISFFGSLYSAHGIHPDPERVADIHLHAMPTPQDKEDLQGFLGVINFVSPYIPNCADKAAPLSDLLRKDVPFLWQDDHQAAFHALKHSITANSCLQYYNPKVDTTLEVDASQKGLGACLIQEGRPVDDKLDLSSGVLFKGRQVIIPDSMRHDILNQLHVGHLGIEKIRRFGP